LKLTDLRVMKPDELPGLLHPAENIINTQT